LSFNNKEIRKTHDIAELIELCCEVDSEFQKLFEWNVDELTVYAVEVRYIDDFYFPSIDETTSAIEKAEKTRSFVLD